MSFRSSVIDAGMHDVGSGAPIGVQNESWTTIVCGRATRLAEAPRCWW